ncbi:Gfo/Idh/MocA family protein [Alkalicoccobacillus plakortidis]|uniref:Gfo/Idh/MocA family oxidoreductase n=1 Tax=Alkalicoccobacillus plakortidis TaxID=444060 RepID=A0ABT0XF04_9BACI|nr:Gfo/Idh/MocA family oxidoreductase [Alkalicoccobacillus plakortidis]MCM2674462.1 Gfo/Idh/MocA family oxidoreductase [Alkalicoccobacillus plakortidis]
MNIGILGTGFGYHHAVIYKQVAGIDSITLFGRDRDKLKKIGEELDIQTTDDIHEVLTNPNIDLIDVCLPSSLHRQYVVEALKNGKHVFCETPVALTLEDAALMLTAEKTYNKRVFVHQFIKHEMPNVYLFKVKQSGELGRLKALHVKRTSPPLWGDLGLHNITTDLMIHDFDFITWLLGSPLQINAQGINGRKRESHIQAALTYSDTIVSVEGSSMMPFAAPFTVGYEAVFEEGRITYQEDSYQDTVVNSFKKYKDNKEEDIQITNKNCYEESLKHVVACCQTNAGTRLSLDAAIKSLEIAIRIKEQVLS